MAEPEQPSRPTKNQVARVVDLRLPVLRPGRFTESRLHRPPFSGALSQASTQRKPHVRDRSRNIRPITCFKCMENAMRRRKQRIGSQARNASLVNEVSLDARVKPGARCHEEPLASEFLCSRRRQMGVDEVRYVLDDVPF